MCSAKLEKTCNVGTHRRHSGQYFFFGGYFGPIFELCRGKMALSVAADFSYRPLDDRNGQLATEIKLNQI